MVYLAIEQLINYGVEKGLIEKENICFVTNQLLEALELTEFIPSSGDVPKADLEEILNTILDDACNRGVIENSIVYRDLLDTKLMGIITPLPSTVIKKFNSLYEKDPKIATDWYYDFSQNTDYIRRYRILKDVKWVTQTQYGELDITINLSKPEKDPVAIAAAKNAPQSGYPKCLLCRENEGYSGRINHPARQNHRLIPVKMASQEWFFQYSPYVYYNEHCIAFNSEHIPMKIDRIAFEKMFDFIKLFPHYFIGSNADLPIVGGSILAHDHFQGGRYTFAMEKAEIETKYEIQGFEDVEVGIVNWPMSVIRIRHKVDKRLISMADYILNKWRGYTDEGALIYAQTNGEPHNTITPIARMRDGKFEMDLVLRNNITTKEHPLGVYHPHSELHHIKKENIGLIEVMGLAVLPSRLKDELAQLKLAILNGNDLFADYTIAKHAQWATDFIKKYDEISQDKLDNIIKNEVGLVFAKVLEDAGVYKRTREGKEAFERFVTLCGGKRLG
ncbi:MAG: UDP-glucose--hexose-1-phosphate uridylyltransferase [Lachnospiraceae bacterium]|nr:UDP-glucose--hexose-1-phosphate uridylyltransferase [Lachnospiraceae bacterium]